MERVCDENNIDGMWIALSSQAWLEINNNMDTELSNEIKEKVSNKNHILSVRLFEILENV